MRLLKELERLPVADRHSIQSITLPRDLMFYDDVENRVCVAVDLAAFLLAWKELHAITIAMPNDLSAAGKETDEYDFWSWALHRPLLAAFAQGRWSEVRLLHPQHYRDPLPFLFHNIEQYVEDWVLPTEPRHQLETRRARYWENPAGDSRADVNLECAQTWAARGITCQQDPPRPEETGTVLAIRWREPWMRDARHAATQPNRTSQSTRDDRLPWQYTATWSRPSFLHPLPQWRVILCKEHENCFTRDTLEHHLICHHGATDRDAQEVALLSPAQDLAETWKDVLHPRSPIQPVPHLQVVKAYSCSDTSCHYRTLTMRDLITHSRETRHLNLQTEKAFFQTLSSDRAELQCFTVFPPDDFVFPLGEVKAEEDVQVEEVKLKRLRVGADGADGTGGVRWCRRLRQRT